MGSETRTGYPGEAEGHEGSCLLPGIAEWRSASRPVVYAASPEAHGPSSCEHAHAGQAEGSRAKGAALLRLAAKWLQAIEASCCNMGVASDAMPQRLISFTNASSASATITMGYLFCCMNTSVALLASMCDGPAIRQPPSFHRPFPRPHLINSMAPSVPSTLFRSILKCWGP